MKTQTMKCPQCGDKGGTIKISGSHSNGPSISIHGNVSIKCFICGIAMTLADVTEEKIEIGHNKKDGISFIG